MLPRAGVRTLRSLRIQPSARVYILSRTYAKVGKPKPPEFKHVASTVATPRKATQTTTTTTTTDNAWKHDTPVRFGKNESSIPRPQDKLGPEAPDTVSAATEAKSTTTVEESAEVEQPSTEGRIPLHDITKGIPSTLDAELREAARSQRRADQTEEVDPETQEPAAATGGSSGRGNRPVRDYTTSTERRRNRMMGWVAGSFLLLLFTGPLYLGRNWESEEEVQRHPGAPNGWGIQLFINRVRARMSTTLDYYNEPAFPKLLPDVDPQLERPYTLVLSLEDLLIHGEWTREHGWRIAKRPGLDYFLRYLQPYYEIVVFTSAPSMVGIPVLLKLDPFGIIHWKLFREATRYKEGKHIKDLSFLNRPLDKIILIDTDASHAEAQPENAVILTKWTGDLNDKELVALIPFLEYTAAMGLPDTRKVLESFKGKHIPTEFAVRETQARKRWKEHMATEKRSRRGGIGMIGSALGIKPDQGVSIPGQISLSEGLAQGKMLHDLIREQGQKQYEAFEKQIRENQDQWMEDIKKDEERMREEGMAQMKQGVFSWFGTPKAKTPDNTTTTAAAGT